MMTPTHNSLILRWPDAVWDVSGAFAYDRELLALFDFFESRLGVTRPFSIVHGAPPISPWNSGRPLQNIAITNDQIMAAFHAYAKRKIAIYYTFSNTRLQKEHLSHKSTNLLCEGAQQMNPSGENAVILASDLLNDYIKKQFPRLKRISSILKICADHGKADLDLYKRYLDEYDYVMMHPDDVFNWDFIADLPEKNRLILLLNDYCIRNCPMRDVHYDSVSKVTLDPYSDSEEKLTKARERNGCLNFHNLLCSKTKPVIAQSDDEVEQLYKLGFRHFKLQGRGFANSATPISDVLRLIMRKDEEAGNRIHSLQQLFWEYLSTANDPILS